ncbi:hypothetical protein [Paracoccus sp. S-4012]|uniref:hypothetical protein n=1 Tax=Paracoccus sp. S-4012 TaxID=2665648 RepID=UPI001E58949B|nr:hypothetical protein [Paracoccus sp. S-4012]
MFREYVASRQAVGKHRDGARAWETMVQDLSGFLGHDDARQVTKRNLLDWRDHLLQSGRSPKSVANGHLAAVRALFRWAFENDRLPTNEAAAVRQEAPRVARSREKGYTTAEAVKVLKASVAYEPAVRDNPANRESAHITAAKRWVPILCAFSGARVTEMTQLRKEDIRKEGGHYVLRIRPDAGTVKAGDYRDVPLHRQIIDLGFLDFLAAVKEGPLFHNATTKERSLSSARATAGRLSQWLQGENLVPVGVQPSHGWRHRFKTQGRELEISDRVIDAIQGHAGKTAGDDYGDVTLATRIAAVRKLPAYDLTSARNPP